LLRRVDWYAIVVKLGLLSSVPYHGVDLIVIGPRSLERGADTEPAPASAAAGRELRFTTEPGDRLLLTTSMPAARVHLVRAWGELAIAGAEQLAACLTGAIAHRSAHLIVELARLSFLGDSGISRCLPGSASRPRRPAGPATQRDQDGVVPSSPAIVAGHGRPAGPGASVRLIHWGSPGRPVTVSAGTDRPRGAVEPSPAQVVYVTSSTIASPSSSGSRLPIARQPPPPRGDYERPRRRGLLWCTSTAGGRCSAVAREQCGPDLG
jgi:hypothetical protein